MRSPIFILLALVCLTAPAAGQPEVDPYAGVFEPTTFTERSPLSTVKAVTQRFRVRLKNPPPDYDLADESFTVYVPQGDQAAEPYGLIVWIYAGDSGAPPRPYLPVLEEHNLIWVGANNSGNRRSFWHRAGLALDALHNIKQQHPIDPMRIYVSGISGGGRSASRVGLTYADEFAGMFAIIGTDFFKRLPHPNSRENALGTTLRFWAPAFNPPNPRVLKRAKRYGRYVLLTGEHDGNRAQTLAAYEYGYQRAKFRHVTYLEVPGMDHTGPPAGWFKQGIEALDASLNEVREEREEKAGLAYEAALHRLSISPKHGRLAMQALLRDYNDTTYGRLAQETLDHPDTAPGLKAPPEQPEPPDPPDPAVKAREALSLAKNYRAAGKEALAQELLKTLIEHYPDTPAAAEAQELLK